MNTKKILGVVAVLALVAVAMVGAGAATETTLTVDGVGTGTNCYKTLDAAVGAMTDATADYVINVTADVNSSGFAVYKTLLENQVITNGLCNSLVINLNGHKVSFTATPAGSAGTKSQCMRFGLNTNVTINGENGTFEVLGGNVTAADITTMAAGTYYYYTKDGERHQITGSTAASDVKSSDMFATMINAYGTLNVNSVTLDGTNLDRLVDQKYYKNGSAQKDWATTAYQYQNVASVLNNNNGTVTFNNVTVNQPVSTKDAKVRAVALEDQTEGNTEGGVNNIVLQISGNNSTINGDVYVNGSYNNASIYSEIIVDAEKQLTINGDLVSTNNTLNKILVPGELILNGVKSQLGGVVKVSDETLIVKSGTVEFLSADTVKSLTDSSVVVKNGGVIVVPNDITLTTFNVKLQSVEAGATVIQQATTDAAGQKEVFNTAAVSPVSTSSATLTEIQKSSGTTIVGYTSDVKYTFVIPASVELTDSTVEYDYSITVTTPYAVTGKKDIQMVATGSTYYVTESSKNYFAVANIADDAKKIKMTITNNGSGSYNTDGSKFVTIDAGNTDTAATATSKMQFALGGTVEKAGNYTDTLSFTVSVVDKTA